MNKTSKRIKAATKVADLEKSYPLAEAIAILQRFPKAKFNETVELQARLGVDPRKSDQMVRGIVNLPAGSGKTVKVVAFTENPDAARAAGADEAGLEDLIKKVNEGWVDFDVAVATTNAMKSLRSVARVLGPRGLMPNPKSGTVTDDIVSAIKSIKLGGRVEFKMDKTANIAVVVGKRSFTEADLARNIQAAIEVIAKARPSDVRGKFIKSLTVSSTMSPGVALSPEIYSNL